MVPKEKQIFNAIQQGRIARGCPCRCTKKDKAVVHGTDAWGNKRIFKIPEWEFEVMVL